MINKKKLLKLARKVAPLFSGATSDRRSYKSIEDATLALKVGGKPKIVDKLICFALLSCAYAPPIASTMDNLTIDEVVGWVKDSLTYSYPEKADKIMSILD